VAVWRRDEHACRHGRLTSRRRITSEHLESASHPALRDSPGNYLYIGDTQNYIGVLEGGSYYAVFEAHPFDDLEESFTLNGFTGVGSISLDTGKAISPASRLRPSEARQFQRLAFPLG